MVLQIVLEILQTDGLSSYGLLIDYWGVDQLDIYKSLTNAIYYIISYL